MFVHNTLRIVGACHAACIYCSHCSAVQCWACMFIRARSLDINKEIKACVSGHEPTFRQVVESIADTRCGKHECTQCSWNRQRQTVGVRDEGGGAGVGAGVTSKGSVGQKLHEKVESKQQLPQIKFPPEGTQDRVTEQDKQTLSNRPSIFRTHT